MMCDGGDHSGDDAKGDAEPERGPTPATMLLAIVMSRCGRSAAALTPDPQRGA
jgi:hypothetical protein